MVTKFYDVIILGEKEHGYSSTAVEYVATAYSNTTSKYQSVLLFAAAASSVLSSLLVNT